jgi:hypothetical protein
MTDLPVLSVGFEPYQAYGAVFAKLAVDATWP